MKTLTFKVWQKEIVIVAHNITHLEADHWVSGTKIHMVNGHIIDVDDGLASIKAQLEQDDTTPKTERNQ